MKKPSIILTVFLCVNLALSAQINKDSLWVVWKDINQYDTMRLNALDKFTWSGCLFFQPDSAFYFVQLECHFTKKARVKVWKANALNSQGLSFYVRGEHIKALSYLTRSLTIYKNIEDKKEVNLV